MKNCYRLNELSKMEGSKIIVIGSTHSEKGVCMSESLYQILCEIEPDYIFLEANPSDYKKVLEGQLQDSLETTAIKKYVKDYDTKHIAIDLSDMPNRESFRKLMNTFSNNDEYNKVLTEYGSLSQMHGFKFLNSAQADQMQDYVGFLESDIVRMINHQEMSVLYEEFKSLTTQRESHWLSTVNEYHSKQNIETSVLLVGAGHRITLKEKLQVLNPLDKSSPNWIFNYFD